MALDRLLWLTLLLALAESVCSMNRLNDKASFFGGVRGSRPPRRGGVSSSSWWSSSSVARVARGGSSPQPKKKVKKRRKIVSPSHPSTAGPSSEQSEDEDPFAVLARALQPDIEDVVVDASSATAGASPRRPSAAVSVERIVDAFQLLSSAQQTFKGLDGAAHEAYQRTHDGGSKTTLLGTSNPEDLVAVSGRASRSAARASAVADGLGACELCELVEYSHLVDFNSGESNNCSTTTALSDHVVLVNETFSVPLGTTQKSNSAYKEELTFRVLVLYEPSYRGGAGVEHGGVAAPGDGGTDTTVRVKRRAHGRLLVIVGDTACQNLGTTISVLARSPPAHVRLHGRGNEAGSIQPTLYKAAAAAIERAEGPLRTYNESAVHIVGRSLAGGVASLTGSILHGSIPMPTSKSNAKASKKRKTSQEGNHTSRSDASQGNATMGACEETEAPPPPPPLQGLGAGRTSVLTLGAPPCMSPNIPSDFITSIVYGDDVVCRASHFALRRLVDRTRRNLDAKGGSIGRSIHWVSDTLSLAASGLKSHAHGSEGEEARLAVPGRAFLVRPRRLGHACSIHEIGSQLKGGREALRAAMLWQLNDVLLSRSMWKHHQLESYIHGLDKVQLRAVDEENA